MQAWADYLDSLRAPGEADASLVGPQESETATDGLQHGESARDLSFQAQAMEALRAIIALCPKP